MDRLPSWPVGSRRCGRFAESVCLAVYSPYRNRFRLHRTAAAAGPGRGTGALRHTGLSEATIHQGSNCHDEAADLHYSRKQKQQRKPKPATGSSKAAIAKQAKAEELRVARVEKLPSEGVVYVPANDGLTAAVLFTNRIEKLCACGFRGRSKKAVFAYHFDDADAREKHVAEWLSGENNRIAENAKRTGAHTLKVGDVLYSSWGYEQTNVDFYEVIAVRGAVVDLIEIGQERTTNGHGMQGTCLPKKGVRTGYALLSKRPNALNQVRITGFASAAPWDGRAKNWSSYA
ncbi:hypothetical protein [Stenotrophomonas oahuensis]|uniref:Uncharacterized protein n=1 Tax=Stenotrophomonas oahuensis TaxID=3003271 RepID=A0ABY9YVD3_9GAMM|nr:hypothetical protein [Stenotrophomonas sp. A5586]WNH54827.1 hypothetical protein PDM29_20655 [Stenotrophomonas sp. A5586]